MSVSDKKVPFCLCFLASIWPRRHQHFKKIFELSDPEKKCIKKGKNSELRLRMKISKIGDGGAREIKFL